MAVIGKEEMSAQTVSIRNLSENKTDTYSINEVVSKLSEESKSPN